ncbi:MAG: hypothetical protein MHMPM18_004558, partial [Marteilia pararefringens]
MLSLESIRNQLAIVEEKDELLDFSINFKAATNYVVYETELEKKHLRDNAAKLRAIKQQNAAGLQSNSSQENYENFRQIVAGSHLDPCNSNSAIQSDKPNTDDSTMTSNNYSHLSEFDSKLEIPDLDFELKTDLCISKALYEYRMDEKSFYRYWHSSNNIEIL